VSLLTRDPATASGEACKRVRVRRIGSNCLSATRCRPCRSGAVPAECPGRRPYSNSGKRNIADQQPAPARRDHSGHDPALAPPTGHQERDYPNLDGPSTRRRHRRRSDPTAGPRIGPGDTSACKANCLTSDTRSAPPRSAGSSPWRAWAIGGGPGGAATPGLAAPPGASGDQLVRRQSPRRSWATSSLCSRRDEAPRNAPHQEDAEGLPG
jgi:hypothetical protein